MTAGHDGDDPAVEIVIAAEAIAALVQEPGEAAADVAEADEREVSAHADRLLRNVPPCRFGGKPALACCRA
jgi:hypothetical protein